MTTDSGSGLFHTIDKAEFEAALPDYLLARRWFGGKARTIDAVSVEDVLPVEHGDSRSYLTILRVVYTDGTYQRYVLPVSVSSDEQRQGAITRVQSDGGNTVLYDATFNPAFTSSLLDSIKEGTGFDGPAGDLDAWNISVFNILAGNSSEPLEAKVMGAEQSNTSIKYGDTLILKLFRRLEEGTSPDLEIGRFLGERGFTHTPPLAGALEYRQQGEPLTLAILQGFVPNQGDAWSFTLAALAEYYPRITSSGGVSSAEGSLLDLANREISGEAAAAVGDYIWRAGLLGTRTAEMHAALASDPVDPAFAPEEYTLDYQREMHAAMTALTNEAFNLLKGRASGLPSQAQDEANALLGRQDEVLGKFGALLERGLSAVRTRCHGDYHLGQVLVTDDDFMIIDFEGEPVRPLSERRLKHSPLKDVAGMLRSFHYAAYSGLFAYRKTMGDGSDVPELLADAWQAWVSAAYLRSYLQTAGNATFLPQNREDLQVVLDAYLLEKAVYELIYELNNRPDWVMIPLKGILSLL